MPKTNDLKTVVQDVLMEFYQEYMKPETREMVEELLDEKLDKKLGPIKAAIITLEKNVSVAIGDYQGVQMQVTDHEKRINTLETKFSHH